MQSQAELQAAMDQAEVNSPEWWNLWARMCQVKGKVRATSENFGEIGKRLRSPVVEIGCGFGVLREYLPDTVAYVCIDLSAVAIQQAQLAHPCGLFVLGNVYATTTFWDGLFTSAVALQVLEHERHPEHLLTVMSILATHSAIVTVPRGIATEHQRGVDGHISEWADEHAFVEQFKQFGCVTFFPGVEHHICAEITWAK